MVIAETAPPYGARPGPADDDMPERALWRLWQKRAARQQEFRTSQGRRVRVLFPGRPGVTAGPDFRAALLEIEGLGLVRGDVEIHRRAEDWDAHGHTDDPNYSGVALHAALETPDAGDSPNTPRPGGGGEIPLISLTPLLSPDAADDDATANAPGEPDSNNPPAAVIEPSANANPGPTSIDSASAQSGNPVQLPGDAGIPNGVAALEPPNANPGQPSGVATAKPGGPKPAPPADGVAATKPGGPNLAPPDAGVAATRPGGPGRLPGNARTPGGANPSQPSGLAITETADPKLAPPDDGVSAAKPGRRPNLAPPDDGVATTETGGPNLVSPDDDVAAAKPGRPNLGLPDDGVAATKPGDPNLAPPDDGVAAAKPGRPKLVPPDDGVAATALGGPKLAPPDDGVAAAKPGRPKPAPPDDGVAAAPGDPSRLPGDAIQPAPSDTPPAFDTLWRLLAAQGFPPPALADEAAVLLDRAGDARFAAKARLLARYIAEQHPQQTLYEALLEGLGYRVNQAPFLRLAQQAPYAAIAQAAGRVLEQQRPAAIAGWLLAASGLDGATNPHRPPGFGSPVARREWALFRVRPANHPARRIQGAGTLLARFLTGPNPPGLAGGLAQAAAAGRPSALTAALTVEAAAGETTAPIGAGRARDLAVNVVLPFLHATDGNPVASPPPESRPPESPPPESPSPESPYLDLYRRFPSLPANEILRQMGEQLLPAPWRKAITGARRQQGLLHLAACLRGANSGSPSA